MEEIKNKDNVIVPIKYLVLHPIQKGMLDIYQGLIEPNYEILDIGCGIKSITRYIKCTKLVGIDIFADYLTKFDILGDIRNIEMFVSPKSFDCLFISDTIEHLTKEEGLKLIKESLIIAKKKVIIFTPVKWTENSDGVENPLLWCFGNTYNLHKSLWTEQEFTNLGFTRIKSIYDADYLIVIKEA